MNQVKMHNGVQIPSVGLGTWQITDRDEMKHLLADAYEAGYRMFDTAAAYCNEMAIGKALEALQLPREELFLSDKVWNTSRGYDNVRDACRRSLKKMKTDYFDLYLIHWPASMALYPDWAQINEDTWRGMESLYDEGLVRAIGVCNFKAHHLTQLQKTARIMPMVNQIEYHPGMMQEDTVEFCKNAGIVIEASSPLGNGQILRNPVLLEIAAKHQKTVAQVCLRWANQREIVVIPKTTNKNRLAENLCFDDFLLSQEELLVIDGISYCGGIGIDSDKVTEYG